MIKLAVGPLGRCPILPAVGLFDDEAVRLAFKRGFARLVDFECVEVLQEQ